MISSDFVNLNATEGISWQNYALYDLKQRDPCAMCKFEIIIYEKYFKKGDRLI